MKKISTIIFLFLLCILTACTSRNILKLRSYGIDYLENQDYENALKYFNEAINEGRGKVSYVQKDILMYKAECLFMLKKYDEALKTYETIKKIDIFDSNASEVQKNLELITGLVNFKRCLDNNEVENAEEILSKLKESGLEHEKSVMYNQAVLYEKKGEWKNALNAFTYYLKQYPNDEDAEHEILFINSQINYAN